ncbi:hypothetical protein ACYATM_05375 [Lactobacillaceae bacterium Scapto_B20]
MNMHLLSPDTLTNLMNGTPEIKRAISLLKDHWQDFADDNPFMPVKINVATVELAKQLAASGLVVTKIDFNDYQAVQAFILRNNSYLDDGAKARLLAPFN